MANSVAGQEGIEAVNFDPLRPEGLYVHIPFCATKCPYCDFNTYAGIEAMMGPYLAALRSEIELWGAVLGGPRLETVFFGGGTPSYLPAGSLTMLIDAVRGSFGLAGGAEITAEANPDDLNADKLASLLEAGVNRLSIGVQSLDNGLLRVLGRRHSAREALDAFRAARQAGFGNVSIDLMYGLPDQTLEQWGATLDMRPWASGRATSRCTASPSRGARPWSGTRRRAGYPYRTATWRPTCTWRPRCKTAEKAGFRHYEISNWAIPGRESRHNLVYWRNRPFLGVGPGAHSYLDGHRFHNIRSPREYIRRVAPGEPRAQPGERVFDGVPVVEAVEPVDRRLEMAETMMMGLRLDTGVEMAGFAARFGESPGESYGEIIEELEDDGLLETAGGSFVLTPRGRLLGNEVFSRFF